MKKYFKITYSKEMTGEKIINRWAWLTQSDVKTLIKLQDALGIFSIRMIEDKPARD